MFYKIALPVYLCYYLLKGDPQLNARLKGFSRMNILYQLSLFSPLNVLILNAKRNKHIDK